MNHGLDKKDRKIIGLVQKNPYLSQSEIAQHVELSQPAAYFRIRKLAKKGFLSRFVGVDIKKIGLPLFKLDVQADDPNTIFPLIDNCPYILDGYQMDGGNVFSLFIAGENLSTLQSVKSCLLKDKGLQQLHFHQIHDGKNNLIMPLPMVEKKEQTPCNHFCQNCSHFLNKACLGCPFTEYYRGTLW